MNSEKGRTSRKLLIILPLLMVAAVFLFATKILAVHLPDVEITAPVDGDDVSGVIDVRVEYSVSHGNVHTIIIYADGSEVDREYVHEREGEHTFSLNVDGYAAGPLVIEVDAFSAAPPSDHFTSDLITLNVVAVECASDADCGDGDDYTEDVCHDPGESSAWCSNDPIECLNNTDCDDGDALTLDSCSDPSTSNSACENTPIACNTDSDCDDGDEYSLDECHDGGTTSAECVNTPIECLGDSDCDDSDSLTLDSCSAPGTVSSACVNTEIECNTDSDCSDSDSHTYDTCLNGGTLSAVCAHQPIECLNAGECGDGDALTIDTCSNPGVPSAACVNTPIDCNNAEDCDDSDTYTEDVCQNGGTISAVCVYSPIECLTSGDCSDGNPLTLDECLEAGTAAASCLNTPIECNSAADCDDSDQYTQDECMNGGTTGAACVYDDIECLDAADCNDGNPLTLDSCSNPGTALSACINTPIECNTDPDCDDSDLYTQDNCENGGTLSAACFHLDIECITSADCNDGDNYTQDVCSGGGTPAASCIHNSIECLNDGDCGDGDAYTADDCVDHGTPASFCINELIECLGPTDCNDDNALTIDTCPNAGTTAASCVNTPIECNTNADCDDSDIYTADSCANGGTLSAACIHNPIECLAAGDCNDGNLLTLDECLEAGTAAASCLNTPIECNTAVDCDDSNNYTEDTCVAGGTINAACVHAEIECLNDADCDDENDLTLDSCASPGAASASCSHDPLECAGDGDCDDGNALTIDACLNPGAEDSTCAHTSIECNTDNDCDDTDAYTQDICLNGGAMEAACEHNIIACLSAADCGDGNALTIDACENAGTPEAACSHVAFACNNSADCDDGNSRTEDSCENGGTTDAVCLHNGIACLNDSDCDDGNALTIDECSDPGSSESACSNTQIACNSDSDCDDDNDYTLDTCSNGGTISAACAHATIACLSDADCADGDSYTEDECLNPGTAGSECSHSTIACLSSADCNDGEPLTIDACVSPGTSSASCSNTPIECVNNSDCDDGNAYSYDTCVAGGTLSANCEHASIECLSAEDCDDGDVLTIDTCGNPGLPSSSCAHTIIACNTAADCDDRNAYTEDACGNGGTVNAFCSNNSIACLSDEDCDDGVALTLDSCNNPGVSAASCSHDPLDCNSDLDCEDENPLTIDSCSAPGTEDSKCSHVSIACNTDEDCDDDNAYTADACNDGGAAGAECSHVSIACLSDADCDDGNSLTTDTCSDPGLTSSSCANTQLACNADADCDDGNSYTKDTCSNPGAPNSTCTHSQIACLSDADCDDGEDSTTDKCSNPGTVESLCENTPVEPEPEPVLTLSITTPADGTITNSSPLSVSGATTEGASVTVNGNVATVNESGAFAADVVLTEGNNTINITATLNGGELSESVTVTLDTKVPSIMGSTPADGAELDITPDRIAVRIEDDPEGVGLKLDSIILTLDGEELAGNYVTTTRSYEVTGADVANGHHMLQVSASDLAGNFVEQTISFVLAGKGPKIKILKLPGWKDGQENTSPESTFESSSASTLEQSSTEETESPTVSETISQPDTVQDEPQTIIPNSGTQTLPSSEWLNLKGKYNIDTILELLKEKYPKRKWDISSLKALTGFPGGTDFSSIDLDGLAGGLQSGLSPASDVYNNTQTLSISGDMEALVEEGDAPLEGSSIEVIVDGEVVPHEYDPSTKKIKSKLTGLKQGSHDAKITASDTDGNTATTMGTFSVSSVADTLTFENITSPGGEIHAGDVFRFRVDSSYDYQYTPGVSLYNPDIEPPANPGEVNPCNVQYLVGEGYAPEHIAGTTYSYEGEGIFYTSADRMGREASRVYAVTGVTPFDAQGNADCLFSANSMTVVNGPVVPAISSVVFQKSADPSARVIDVGEDYTITANGSPGIMNVEYWLIDPDKIVGEDVLGAAVENGEFPETGFGSGVYELSPTTLTNVTPSGGVPARFILALVKPVAWNQDIPPGVSDILYIGPAPAPVFNTVEVSNADHPGDPLRPGEKYLIHVQADVDYAHQDHLKVVLVNADHYSHDWKPYYGTGLFIPGTEAEFGSGLNWMDPGVYGPGVYQAEGFMPQLTDADGQPVTNVRAIVTAASYFDHAASDPVPAEQQQQKVTVENIRLINNDHPDWMTVAPGEMVRIEAEADPGLGLECAALAGRFDGGETMTPVIMKPMTEGPDGVYACEDVVTSRPDIDGEPVHMLVAMIMLSGSVIDMSDDLLTYRDAIQEVHFRNISRPDAPDIAPGEQFQILAVGQSGLSDFYGGILDAAIFHTQQDGPFQPTDPLIEDPPGSGKYRIEATLASVPDGVKEIRGAIGDPHSAEVKPVVSTEILTVVTTPAPEPPVITHVNDAAVHDGEVTSDAFAPVVTGTAEPDSTVRIYEFIEGEGTELETATGGLDLSATYVPAGPVTISDDFETDSPLDYGYSGSSSGGGWCDVNETGGEVVFSVSPFTNCLLYDAYLRNAVYISADYFKVEAETTISWGGTQGQANLFGSLGMEFQIDNDTVGRKRVAFEWNIDITDSSPNPSFVKITFDGNEICQVDYVSPSLDTTYNISLEYRSETQAQYDVYIDGSNVASCTGFETVDGRIVDPGIVVIADTGSDDFTVTADNLAVTYMGAEGYEVSGPALSMSGVPYDGFGTGGGMFVSPCSEMQPSEMPVVDQCVTGEKDIYAFLVTATNVMVEGGMVIPELKVTFYTAGDPQNQYDDQLDFIKGFFDFIKGQFIEDYSIDAYARVLIAPEQGAPDPFIPVTSIISQQMLCTSAPGSPGWLRWNPDYDNGDGTFGAYLASYTPLAKDGAVYDDYVIWGPSETGDGPNPVYGDGAPIWWADGSEDVAISLMRFSDGTENTGYGIEAFFETAPPEITFVATATQVLLKPDDPGHATPDPDDDHYTWNQPALDAQGITVAPVTTCTGGVFHQIGETISDGSGDFATQVISFADYGDHTIVANSTKNETTTKWSDPVIYRLQTGGPVDTTPPSITFVSISEGDCTNEQQPIIEITITDTESGVKWSDVTCDTDASVSCGVARIGATDSAEITFNSMLPEGSVTIAINAGDLASPQNRKTESLTIYVDVTPPLAFATAPQAWPEPGIEGEYDDDTEIHLTFDPTDDNPGGCGIDSYYAGITADLAECGNVTSQVAAGVYEHTATGTEGLNYYCVAAEDRAGNRTTASDTITIDLTDPVILNAEAEPEIFSPALGQTANISAYVDDANPYYWKVVLEHEQYAVDFTAEDYGNPGVLAEWSGDGCGGQTCPDGTYSYYIYAEDRAFRIANPVSGTLAIDTQGPGITFLYLDENAVNPAGKSAYTLNLAIEDLAGIDETNVAVHLDGSSAPDGYADCSENAGASGLRGYDCTYTLDFSNMQNNSQHTVTVTAIDTLGQASEKTVAFKILSKPVDITSVTFEDTTAPADGVIAVNETFTITINMSKKAGPPAVLVVNAGRWPVGDSDVLIETSAPQEKQGGKKWVINGVLRSGTDTGGYAAGEIIVVASADGFTTESQSSALTVDQTTTPPPKPILKNPKNNDLKDGDTIVTITGENAGPFNTVRIFLVTASGPQELSPTDTSDVNGNFDVTIDFGTTGKKTIYAVAEDGSGQAGPQSDAITFDILDKTAPVVENLKAEPNPFSPVAAIEEKQTTTISANVYDDALAEWKLQIVRDIDARKMVDLTSTDFDYTDPDNPAISYVWDGYRYKKNGQRMEQQATGTFTFRLRVWNADGKKTDWLEGSVRIDTDSPVVAITDPASGTLIGGVSYSVTIEATDTLAIEKVVIYVDFSGIQDEPHSVARYDATSTTYIANLYPKAITDGSHTVTAVAYDTAGNWSDPAAPGASINIIVDNVVPNPPINLTATENSDGTVTLTWEPPTTNEDGSALTDLAGYNIYSVTEENRCESIYPVSGDSTPLVCEPGMSPGTFTINGPTLSFDNIDYNNTPFGTTAVWLDVSNQQEPVVPLPLNESATVDPSKPVFAFLLKLVLTERTGLTPGEYSITAYTQNSWAEIEDWQRQSIEYGAMIVDSRIVSHTLACANSNLSGFVTINTPFDSIPEYSFIKMNGNILFNNYWITNYISTNNQQLITVSVDINGNISNFSNFVD